MSFSLSHPVELSIYCSEYSVKLYISCSAAWIRLVIRLCCS